VARIEVKNILVDILQFMKNQYNGFSQSLDVCKHDIVQEKLFIGACKNLIEKLGDYNEEKLRTIENKINKTTNDSQDSQQSINDIVINIDNQINFFSGVINPLLNTPEKINAYRF